MDDRETELQEMRLRGGSSKTSNRVADRENDYQRQHRQYLLSPKVYCILSFQKELSGFSFSSEESKSHLCVENGSLSKG